MASHFECLGFHFDDSDSFEQVTIDLLSRGKAVPRGDGGDMFVWTDRSGARLVGNSNDRNELDCVTPTLVAPARLDVRPMGWSEDSACRFCDRLHLEVINQEGELFYPLAIQVDDIGMTRSRLPLGKQDAGGVTAFAETVEFWKDEAAFHAAQKGDVPLAPESLIPVGLFVSEGEEATAHALITGRIVESEVRTNTATHRPFLWALVATLGGSYDAVFSATDAPEAPRSGQIVQGTFWLVGRVGIGETLRVERRRGLRGLFDR